MNDISESEARALLTKTLFCEDCESWKICKDSTYTHKCGSGLLDGQGVNVSLLVELSHFRHPITKQIRYVFSVFKKHPYGLDRVYQLDVLQCKKTIKNRHSKPHEHIGNKRIEGHDTWSNWSYDDCLRHFCNKTNITFNPAIQSPDNFNLR
jgi:hypothetical protein